MTDVEEQAYLQALEEALEMERPALLRRASNALAGRDRWARFEEICDSILDQARAGRTLTRKQHECLCKLVASDLKYDYLEDEP